MALHALGLSGRHLTLSVALSAAFLLTTLPAQAQQVDAGAGDNININGQTITTVSVPALLAHDTGRIFNTLGAGNDVRFRPPALLRLAHKR